MNMCQKHWDKLREAINDHGLGSLVADSSEKAARNFAEQAQGAEVNLDNYDPLMQAWVAICSNGMRMIEEVGGNPMSVLAYDDSFPFDNCVICFLNWIMDEHDKECTNPDCQKPKGELAHYEWMIDRAAEDQIEVWKGLRDA